MIQRILDDKRANKCDILLTKLIQDEKQYDDSIDCNFKVKDYFKNVIKNEDNILLCNIEDDNINGYIYLKPLINNNIKGYLIDGLYVEKNFRNKGIGSNLINEALKILKNTDAKFIDINVLADNKIANKLYKSFGFNEFKINMRKDLNKIEHN